MRKRCEDGGTLFNYGIREIMKKQFKMETANDCSNVLLFDYRSMAVSDCHRVRPFKSLHY